MSINWYRANGLKLQTFVAETRRFAESSHLALRTVALLAIGVGHYPRGG
jgi:hypothetical protein